MKRIGIFICIWVMVFSMLPLQAAAEEGEVRACWVASVGNLDFPSRMGLSSQGLKDEIDAIIENCKDMGLNTIFFQVRPTGDALYRSEIFPWSAYLTGTQGKAPDSGFDPLAYFIERAHKAKIQLHAWINPYRIGTGTNVWSRLSADNPAVLHPEYTVTTADGLYYNPGLPEVRKLILDGVEEIARNYAIDGIHFDDYFYPYNNEDFDDSAAYSAYGKGLSLADFRRDAVDQLVSKVGSVIKKHRKECQFGISPFGIWANKWVHPAGSETTGLSAYSDIFADSKKWVEEGWLDYICPQLYWSFDHKAAPFGVLVDWWDTLCVKNKVKLYIGLALYKVGTDEVGFEDGIIMNRQLHYISKKRSYAGHCFFRYGTMIENPLGALDAVLSYYNGEEPMEKRENRFLYDSADFIQPIELKKADGLKITSPESGTTVNAGRISVTGTAPAGQAVTVNGIRAVTNSYGLFSAYVPLSKGSNRITAVSGGAEKSISVTYQEAEPIGEMQGAYPSGAIHRGAGEVLTVYLQAPAGSSVVFQNQWVSVPLTPTKNDPCLYRGEWLMPSLPQGETLLLDGFSYIATLNGQTSTLATDLNIHLYSEGYQNPMELKSDAYIFDESIEGSQMDHDPLRLGTELTVCGLEGTRALLKNGFWVEQETLGSEALAAEEPLDYPYERVVISCEEDFSYYTEYNEPSLEIFLKIGQKAKVEIDSEHRDLSVKLNRRSQNSVVSVTSASGRVLAGYEVYLQKNRITLCLRYHTDELKGKRILLDVGHGGADVGALSAGGAEYPAESELNLTFAKYLFEELTDAGAEVTLMAAGAETLSLDKRVELAEEFTPDLFLSVHHNSTDQSGDFSKVSGGMVLYSSPLSAGIADWVAAETMICRRQSLRVCRQTKYPAIMLEVGYLCNPLDYELLCNEDKAREIAENTVERLKDYFVTNCS